MKVFSKSLVLTSIISSVLYSGNVLAWDFCTNWNTSTLSGSESIIIPVVPNTKGYSGINFHIKGGSKSIAVGTYKACLVSKYPEWCWQSGKLYADMSNYITFWSGTTKEKFEFRMSFYPKQNFPQTPDKKKVSLNLKYNVCYNK